MPAIRVDAPPGPADNKTVLGLDATVEPLDSQVCALCTELLAEECTEADEDEALCVYVDHGQCGRESGDGRPGEFNEMEPGRGEDILDEADVVAGNNVLYIIDLAARVVMAKGANNGAGKRRKQVESSSGQPVSTRESAATRQARVPLSTRLHT